MAVSYKKAGVDVEKAEKFVSNIKKFLSTDSKAFSGVFPLKKFLSNKNNPMLVSSSDGVGTKLLLAQKFGIHNTVGIDLVAMNVNDLICLGAKPLFFLDYIACGKLNNSVLEKVMEGIYNGVKQSDSVLVGGETAEMPDMYKKDEYDLAGFSVGIVDKSRVITGKKIKAGDVVIGIASSGIHSNGYSLVRKIFKSEKDLNRYKKELLEPTRIYVKPVLKILDKFGKQIHGIAHITGGAWFIKAVKVLPQELGFYIKRESWIVPEIFNVMQKKGKLSFKEMYSTFNMGIGMILIVSKTYADNILKLAGKFEKSYIIGEVVKSKEKIKFV